MTLSITRPSALPPADSATDAPCRIEQTEVPAHVCRPQRPYRGERLTFNTTEQRDRGGASHGPFRPDDAIRSPSKPNSYLSQRRMP